MLGAHVTPTLTCKGQLKEVEAIWHQKYENAHEHCRMKDNEIPGNLETIGIVGRLIKQNKLVISRQDATK